MEWVPRARSPIRAGADKPDTLVAARAAEQWGAVSTADLRGCGLTRDAILHRVRAGRLHPIHRGVYAVGHPRLTLEGRFLAAVKACGPRAVLSHRSAAVLWGLLDPVERYPDVTVPVKRERPGINTHRTRSLVDAVVVHRAIPVTTPKRTLHDLARTLPDKTLRRAVREALTQRLIRPQDLAAGGPRIRAIVPAPTRSVLEDMVLDLILTAGFARLDVNVPLHIGGALVIPDFRWPAERLIVEADGAAYHAHTRDEDAQRQALLEAHGERVLRITYAQATERRRETVRRLRLAGAPLD